MAEPPQPPPTAPVPASTSPIEAVKQEASLKTDQSQATATEADKKDRKPDEPESALREVGARLQEAAASPDASSHSKLSQEARQPSWPKSIE